MSTMTKINHIEELQTFHTAVLALADLCESGVRSQEIVIWFNLALERFEPTLEALTRDENNES
jgi:hypothetical protein